MSRRTPLGRLRLVGLIEGLSFLLLLGVAMPLKYLADWPWGVKVLGMAHGLLWVLFLASVAEVTFAQGWSVVRVAGAVLASLVPCGTFVLDAALRREQVESEAATSA